MISAFAIRSLEHCYNGKTVLEIPHLDIPAGTIWAFLGPNGSGKTTLLRILGSLLTPLQGSVSVNGVEATAHRLRQLRRQVTLIHQKPVLFSTTVRNNVSYGLRVSGVPRGEIQTRVAVALEEFGISKIAERNAAKLSGGEAQRVVLARGLVLETPIILLDEPTSFLDAEVRVLLVELLRKANRVRGATIVIATHDSEFVSPLAQRVLRLDAGRIVNES